MQTLLAGGCGRLVYLSEDEYRALQWYLLINPDAGDQMPGISFVEVMGFERLDGLRRAKGKAVA